MMKTVKDHIEDTRKRLAEAAAARQAKSPNGSMPTKNAKPKLPKQQGNVPKPAKKPRSKGK